MENWPFSAPHPMMQLEICHVHNVAILQGSEFNILLVIRLRLKISL
jgi:hypothetical protein